MTKTEYALRTLWKRCVSMAFFFSCGCLWQNPVFIVEESEKMNSKHISKLPSITALQVEYAALQKQKEALYADYGKLKKQVKEYDVIKQNIDSILKVERQPERAKETERG